MGENFNTTLERVIWTAHQLFYRKLVTGSTGNISFLYEDSIYISQSGCCFGNLNNDSFARVDMTGKSIYGTPSKEYPLHMALYKKNKDTTAIIHTHSLYSTAISCMEDIYKYIHMLYSYTPYLEMMTKGEIHVVPYGAPGSTHLFKVFEETIREDTTITILRNHGIVVASNTIESAFNIIEEFETSARLLWILNQQVDTETRKIR